MLVCVHDNNQYDSNLSNCFIIILVSYDSLVSQSSQWIVQLLGQFVKVSQLFITQLSIIITSMFPMKHESYKNEL